MRDLEININEKSAILDRSIVKYILMHTIGGFLMLYATLLPIFMNKLGIPILYYGVLMSLASIMDIAITFALSKKFDKISPNIGIALDWITESIPPFIYAFALSPLHFMFGIFATKLTNVLNPMYRVYESFIYPAENREKIYKYHLIIPETINVILLPVVGYLLTYTFPSIEAFRIVFFISGIGFIFLSSIPLKKLKWIEPQVVDFNKECATKPEQALSKVLIRLSIAEIFVMISMQMTSQFVLVYFLLDKIEGNTFHIFSINAFSALVLVLSGFMSKNKKVSNGLFARSGIILLILYTGVLSISNSLWLVLLAILIGTIGRMKWFPAHSSLIMQYVPDESRGVFFGKLNSIGKIATFLVPVMTAMVVTLWGYSIVFSLAVALYIMSYFIYKNLEL